MQKINLEQVRIEDLVWQPDRKADPILDHISAMLHSGEFYGILGPNGAGKTSIVRQILRLKESSGGAVYYDDKNIRQLERGQIAERFSFLPQNIKSDVDFSVFDVVAMGREPHRKKFAPLTELDYEKIEEAMRFTNCLDMKDKSITVLSGGERQRVMIARTIAQDTPWVILDEPVSALDVKHQAEIMVVLERLRREKGKTIIAILHDLNLAAEFCTQLILMKSGHVYKAGAMQEVLCKEVLEAVYEMRFEFLARDGEAHPYIVPKFSHMNHGFR